MATDRIEREIHINATRQRVWEVLTDPDQVSRWFSNSTQADLRPGGKMVFTWEEHGGFHAVIDRIEPPGFFSYRWARPVGEEPVEGNSTLVEFTLSESGTGTLLRVVESGFASLKVSADEQVTAMRENTEGWTNELGELQEYAQGLAA